MDEPGAWEEHSKQRASVSFDIEPNSLEDPDFPEVPESWLGSAQKVAKKAASLIVVELCCEEGSALSKACSSIPEVAYFGVTKEVDLLSYNGLRLLQEVFGVLSYGTVRVYAHLSTPCSAGCGLRHLRFKKGGKALERWRANVMKALRWYRKLLGLSPFPDLYSAAFASLVQPASGEKRESLPLPLSFHAFLERKVLDSDTPTAEAIWAGSFLACIGGSLRFSDAQHVLWSSLCISHFHPARDMLSYKDNQEGRPFCLFGLRGSLRFSRLWHELAERVDPPSGQGLAGASIQLWGPGDA